MSLASSGTLRLQSDEKAFCPPARMLPSASACPWHCRRKETKSDASRKRRRELHAQMADMVRCRIAENQLAYSDLAGWRNWQTHRI